VRKIAGGVVLAAFAAVSPARAQRVSGTLVDSATREPLAGAVVTLSDSAGGVLARSIVDATGAFSVSRLPATRALRVVRIGYEPRELRLSARDTVVALAMQPIAARLGAMTTTDRRICSGTTDNSGAFDLWEQARAGLLASVVSRQTTPPHVRLRSFRRTLGPVLREPLGDTVEYNDVVVNRSFVAARPAWVFAENGYMREGVDGMREFYAPDEEVLLDRTFVGTHCLGVTSGRGEREGLIGLTFEPVSLPDRDTLVDVNGTLWLDRATLALHDLEYRYTNLEPEARNAGGEIDFTVMPNGVPMIRHWRIHTPMLAHDVPTPIGGPPPRILPRAVRRNIRVLGYREIGGQIASARWNDGSTWVSEIPHLRGRVTDASGDPVANAFVWLKGQRDTVRTRADGRFDLSPAPPGLYVVLASDSALAHDGIARSVPVQTMVFADSADNLRLDYRPRSEVLASLCPARSYKPGTGVVLARVVDASGRAVEHAEVQVETTSPPGSVNSESAFRVGESGADGRFAVCGVTEDRPVIVRAFKGRTAGGIAIERWGDEVVSVTITLRSPDR
jgi:hypothetical protein